MVKKQVLLKLIKKTFKNDFPNLKFKKTSLSYDLLVELKTNYYCKDFAFWWYDSGPKIENKEEYRMYLDYEKLLNEIPGNEHSGTFFWYLLAEEENLRKNDRFSHEEHSIEELKVAYDKVTKIYKEYEFKRLSWSSFCDYFADGVNGFTQKGVNRYAFETLCDCKKWENTEDRFYIAFDTHNEQKRIHISIFGRDIDRLCDYHFCFEEKQKDSASESDLDCDFDLQLDYKEKEENDIRLVEEYEKYLLEQDNPKEWLTVTFADGRIVKGIPAEFAKKV